MYRTVAPLEIGQVLEVISRDPGSRIEIPDWCSRTGHLLLSVLEHGDETLFWIRKRSRGDVQRPATSDIPRDHLTGSSCNP